MAKGKIFEVDGTKIRTFQGANKEDYICITDIARQVSGKAGEIVKNYFRTRPNVGFLGEWEIVHNKFFNKDVFQKIYNRAGEPTFTLSVKEWVEKTKAIGIEAKAGRYGGTYAHKDIAFAFAYWMQPRFQIYLIKEFQRLKYVEAQALGEPFAVQREIAKANDKLLNIAIDKYEVPPHLAGTKKGRLYHAHEQDIINLIVYGEIASSWKRINPNKAGNQRDYATAIQLVVHNNLLSMDSHLLKWMVDKDLRESILLHMAKDQFEIFKDNKAVNRLQKRIDELQKLLGRSGQVD
ncbi:MAG: KilA-N domain-containing protein [Saprospiraceae bacterium]